MTEQRACATDEALRKIEGARDILLNARGFLHLINLAIDDTTNDGDAIARAAQMIAHDLRACDILMENGISELEGGAQ